MTIVIGWNAYQELSYSVNIIISIFYILNFYRAKHGFSRVSNQKIEKVAKIWVFHVRTVCCIAVLFEISL